MNSSARLTQLLISTCNKTMNAPASKSEIVWPIPQSANIFEAAVTREAAQRRLVDELLGLFGGRSRPIMAHLIESGNLTLDDVREAERTLLKIAGEEKS